MTRFKVGLMLAAWLSGAAVANAQTSIYAIRPQTSSATLSAAANTDADCLATSCLTLNSGGFTGLSVQVVGTCGTCTVQFTASNDNTVYNNVYLFPIAGTTAVSSTTSTGTWQGGIVGSRFRIRMSGWSSGSFVVTIYATMGPLARVVSGSSDPLTASSLTLTNGGAVRTGTTANDTALLQAYDVDNTTYRTFGTLTAANTPSFALAPPSGGTLSGAFSTLSQGGFAVTLAGTLTTVGANALSLTTTGATSVTLPTSGTLATTAGTLSSSAPTTTGSTPTVADVGAASCGTSAATIVGNDTIGVITVGATAGTQCRVTFTAAASTARVCVPTDSTTTIATRATYIDATHTDFLGAFVAGDSISFICLSR